MTKEFNATAAGQKEMFYAASKVQAKKNASKMLDLARQKRYDAVKAWRAAGAVEEDFDSFVSAADKAEDVAVDYLNSLRG